MPRSPFTLGLGVAAALVLGFAWLLLGGTEPGPEAALEAAAARRGGAAGVAPSPGSGMGGADLEATGAAPRPAPPRESALFGSDPLADGPAGHGAERPRADDSPTPDRLREFERIARESEPTAEELERLRREANVLPPPEVLVELRREAERPVEPPPRLLERLEQEAQRDEPSPERLEELKRRLAEDLEYEKWYRP